MTGDWGGRGGEEEDDLEKQRATNTAHAPQASQWKGFVIYDRWGFSFP